MSADFASLHGLRAVVTGSSSGIGRAIAQEFSKAGAKLVLHHRQSPERINTLLAELRQAGGECSAFAADFSIDAELSGFFQQAVAALGGVDIWVNNAGVDLLTSAERENPYSRKLEKLWLVDVRSTVELSRLAADQMKNSGGCILNIGWDQADRGMGGDSGELFSTSKNAIMGFSRSLAVSVAPQVRVNCIAPGWIRTAWGETASDYWQQRVMDETPLQRWGTPEDIARLARFLASPDASFITGQVINVNGGAVR